MTGNKLPISSAILSCLDPVVFTFTQLSNTGIKSKLNRPAIIAKMEANLKKGGFVFSRGEAIYDKLMSQHTDNLVVNNHNNIVKQCHFE